MEREIFAARDAITLTVIGKMFLECEIQYLRELLLLAVIFQAIWVPLAAGFVGCRVGMKFIRIDGDFHLGVALKNYRRSG